MLRLDAFFALFGECKQSTNSTRFIRQKLLLCIYFDATKMIKSYDERMMIAKAVDLREKLGVFVQFGRHSGNGRMASIALMFRIVDNADARDLCALSRLLVMRMVQHEIP